MTEIMAAESARGRRPTRVRRGVLEQIEEIGMNGALEYGIAAHQNVGAPQRLPCRFMRGLNGIKAGAARTVGGGRVSGAGAGTTADFPTIRRSRHEFGESIGAAALH